MQIALKYSVCHNYKLCIYKLCTCSGVTSSFFLGGQEESKISGGARADRGSGGVSEISGEGSDATGNNHGVSG